MGSIRARGRAVRRVAGALALAALAAGGAVADDRPAATAQAAQHDFSIPPQPLADALAQFGRQSGMQVSVHGDVVRGLTTQGVSGTMTAESALGRLLEGSGITFSRTDAGTVTLRKATGDSSGATMLGPITVTGAGETAWGPVSGYAATRSATATKTDTPILDTPASIQVVPREVIDDQGALNLKDVYDNVSSVQQAGNTLNAQTEVLPIIRGFESPTLFRNGLRSTTSGAVDLVNVERVEVLKGPASILFGALEPGGIVNYVTKRPQATPRHVVEQRVGSYRLFRSTVDTTGPLTEDGSLLYRLDAAYTSSGSFRDHVDLDRVAVAPSLQWQPAPGTELLLDVSYVREEQPYDTGIPLSEEGAPLVSRNVFFGDPDLKGRVIDDLTASYQLTHEINPVWSLRNQFQFHRAKAKNEAIRPRSVVESGGVDYLTLRYQNEDRRDDEYQFVLDATADFATGPVEHTLLLGTELLYQDSDFRRYRENIAPVVISDDVTVDFTPPSDQPQQVIQGTTKWAGFYAQDQLSLLEGGRLKLLLGGRYDVVHQEQETDGVASPTINEQALTGRAGLLYEVTGEVSAYATVAQSFLPQSVGTVDVDGNPIDPEEGIEYEVGVKAGFFDDRLIATAALFHLEKKNVAVLDSDLFNATGQIAYFPGVKQRSRGFEIDVSGALTEQINVIANYSYTDTKVLENAGDPSMVGDPLGGVPTHMARLWATYRFDEGSPLSGLALGGGLRYVGESTAQFDTDIRLDPYVVFDAGAWYEWETVKLGLNIYNLFDKDYIVRASNQAIAHPGEPLTVIGSLSLRF